MVKGRGVSNWHPSSSLGLLIWFHSVELYVYLAGRSGCSVFFSVHLEVWECMFCSLLLPPHSGMRPRMADGLLWPGHGLRHLLGSCA